MNKVAQEQPEQQYHDETVDLSDLHEMISGLRMTSWTSFVDPDAIDSIESLVKDLPHPESLYDYARQPEAINAIKEQIGQIMSIAANFPMNNVEYRERHKSKRKLPPRHPVIEMQPVVETPMQNAAETIQSLVKVSAMADDKGLSKIASNILQYAKQNELSVDDLHNIKDELEKSGLSDEIEILRQAGLWDKFKKLPENFRTNHMNKALTKTLKDLNTMGLQIEKWLRQYPDNETLKNVYTRMNQMHYIGQEVFNMFDEDQNESIGVGESFDDGSNITKHLYDADLSGGQQAQPKAPVQQQQQDQTHPLVNETGVNAGKQKVTDIISFLSDESNAQRVLDAIGDTMVKDYVRRLPGNISNQILTWLGAQNDPNQAVMDFYQSNVILRQSV